MKKSYWVAGVLAVVLSAGVVGMANADRGGACQKGGPGSHGGPAPVSFEVLDADGDGKVTPAELEAQKAARFKASDTNGDGMLSVEEMVEQSKRQATERRTQRVKQMVERLDSDGDGMLSVSEMEAMGKGRQAAKGEGMFKRLDADGDGAISAKEYEAREAGPRMGRKGPRMGDGPRMEHKGGRMQRDCQPGSQ